MPQHWDPEEVLGLVDIGRCVGYAPSKGRKCMNIIRRDNVQRMESILAQLEERNPDAGALRRKLRQLAQCGLCVRYHQDQVDDMVDKWSRKIRAAFPVTEQSEIQIQTLQQTICSLQQMVQCMQRRLDMVEQVSPSRVLTEDITTLNLSRASTATTTGSSRSQRSRSSVTTAAVVHQQAPSQRSSRINTNVATTVSPASPVQEPVTPTTPRCTRTHATRRSVDETCPICCEDGLLSETPESDLSWCKQECGKSFHRECMDAWRASRAETGTAATCPSCRTAWVDDCDC